MNRMLAKGRFCMGAKQTGLQTYDMFASTWVANYDMFTACHCPQLHASLLSRSKMPLLPPMLRSLLFGHSNPSSVCCPTFTTIASCCPLTLVVVSHCSPLLLPSMVGCCILSCSIALCLLHCPPLPSLTLLLPATALSTF